jgi:RNA polymerase-associated protein LEO1
VYALFRKTHTDSTISARKLDDEELDSGDDEGRTDRVHGDDQVEEAEEQTFNFMDADIARHAVPEPSDGELYFLRVPQFLAIEPRQWNQKTFQPPTTDHHSKTAPSDHFSPYNTAMSTIRWRRSPSNPSQLQSNARILRWSDGSFTLQLASQPMDQYQIDAKELAPGQLNPKKPTPTMHRKKPAQDPKESYTYLVAPYAEAQVMRVTNHLTTQLHVQASANATDGAVEILQNALAKAANRQLDNNENAISFINVQEDPELIRARQEAQYKEKLKQTRAKEKQEMREREKATRRMGGMRSSGYGLSIGGLEDEDGGRRGGARKPRPKTGLRRDWSDDEDYDLRGGRTREDDYDEEDDFIAASDEEPEIVEDDDDDDDGIVESPRRGRETQSPKRYRGGDDDDDVIVNRTKRRRVVEDDDDEDE